MCTVLLPPGGNPIAVNKYILSSGWFFQFLSEQKIKINRLILLVCGCETWSVTQGKGVQELGLEGGSGRRLSRTA
jgi:hypothetical protein